MEKKQKRMLLQCIINVYDAAKENKLDDALFEKIVGDLKELSGYFEVSKMQTFFLANDFLMRYKNEPESIMILFKYPPATYSKFLRHIEIIYSYEAYIKR